MLEIILFSILLLYAQALFPWRKRRKVNVSDRPFRSQTHFSVLVPFRNEGNQLEGLLKSFKQINYSKEHIEFIFINDHSLDNGPNLLKKLLSEFPFEAQLLELSDGKGKKAALAKGVDFAKGEIMITTDADCRVHEDWVSSYEEIFTKKGADFSSGMVILNGPRTFLSLFQKLEQAFLMKLTSEYMKANRPILANAANMAFRKDVFQTKFLQQENSSSGDDIFLLHALKENTDHLIFFNENASAAVYTQTKSGFLSLLSQRLRWASKSRYYKDMDTRSVGAIVFITNISLLLLFIFTLFDHSYLLIASIFLSVKFMIEVVLLLRSKHYISDSASLVVLPLYALLYPFYSVGIALLSLLFKPKWKGRKI